MQSNAPAMRKAGPITLAGSPRLQPGATRARTPGTAALARNDCSPRSILPQLSLLHVHDKRRLAGAHAVPSRETGRRGIRVESSTIRSARNRPAGPPHCAVLGIVGARRSAEESRQHGIETLSTGGGRRQAISVEHQKAAVDERREMV